MSSKITPKRYYFSQTNMINFTGAACRPDKGREIMALYKTYPAHIILLRRAFAVVAGVALPVMLFWKDRARFYSWLHRVWAKTSEQPVWMAQAEKAAAIFTNSPCCALPNRAGFSGGFFVFRRRSGIGRCLFCRSALFLPA
jgi:hypothetical protein